MLEQYIELVSQQAQNAGLKMENESDETVSESEQREEETEQSCLFMTLKSAHRNTLSSIPVCFT